MLRSFELNSKIKWEVPPGWHEKQKRKLQLETRKLKLKKLFNDNKC